jgi:hypothetical protein
MNHQNRFLTAEWNNILMLSYAVAGTIRSIRNGAGRMKIEKPDFFTQATSSAK